MQNETQEFRAAQVSSGRFRMTSSHRALIEVWMMGVEARMLALSMRCQERAGGAQ